MKTNPILNINKKVFIFLGMLACFSGHAQDIHFSQFYQVPQLVNPSLAGVFNGDFRGIVNYRDQWSSIAPYKTYSLGIDGGILKKKFKDKYLGAGLFIFQDAAGDSKLTTTQVNLSLSSVIMINKSHNVAAGIQGGFAQRKLDDSGLRWGTQYDGNGYASQITSGEANVFENYSFGDFSAGLSWGYTKSSTNISSNNHFSANAGIAIYHLNTPKQGVNLDNLHSEFIAHAGLNIGLKGTTLSLIPSFLYLQQGPLYEIISGGMFRHTIKEESKYTGLMKEIAVLIGAYYRVGDAVIPSFMFEISNFALGISYDINVSSLKEASNGAGAMEISFRYLTPNPFRSTQGSRYTPML